MRPTLKNSLCSGSVTIVQKSELTFVSILSALVDVIFRLKMVVINFFKLYFPLLTQVSLRVLNTPMKVPFPVDCLYTSILSRGKTQEPQHFLSIKNQSVLCLKSLQRSTHCGICSNPFFFFNSKDSNLSQLEISATLY